MEFKYVIYERKDAVAVIKLNRPKALNALNEDVLTDLDGAITEAEKDETIRVIVITGEGKAFAAGADIGAMVDMNTLAGLEYIRHGQRIYRHIESVNKPVIAAVNGFALGGGCELSLACDLRIASTKAQMGLPETGLGIIPGFGGTQRLARLIGDGKAKEIIFTAGMVNAEEALNIGLVNKVVEPDLLMDEAMALAKKISSKAPIALGMAKNAINRGRQVDIDSAMDVEAMFEVMCFSTEDKREGMTAFIEKRKAEYKGR